MAKALVNSAGKVLLRDGKVATTDSAACCCGGNTCTGTPTGDCLHWIDFEFNIDQTEVDAGGLSGDFIDFAGFGFYADYDAANWILYGPTDQREIPMSGTGNVAGTWHSGRIVLDSDNSATVTVFFCVDAIISETWTELAVDVEDFNLGTDELIAGSANPSGAISHHSIRNIFLTNNDPIDVDDPVVFSFPPDSFDSTSGTGISTSGGVVRVDNDSSDSLTATKTLDSLQRVTCCCDLSTVAEINTISLDFVLTGTWGGLVGSGVPECVTVNMAFSKTWTNVADPGDTPDENQFRFFCNDDGKVSFEAGRAFNPPSPGLFMENGNLIDSIPASGVTCKSPNDLSHNTTEDPDNNEIDANIVLGDFGDFIGDHPPCGSVSLRPTFGGFVRCKDDTTLTSCGPHSFGDEPGRFFPRYTLAFEDLIGTHVYVDANDYPLGLGPPVDGHFVASWTLTIS